MPDGVFKYKKAGKPAWGVRLKFQDDEGRWRAKTWRGFESQSDAIEYRDRQRAERYREKYFPDRPKAQTVRDYFDHWLNTYARHSCKYSTYTSYARVLNKYLLPALGHRPLSTLTAADLKTLLGSLTGKRRQTIRNIFTPIREGLAHAVAEDRLPANPALALGPHLRQIRDPRQHVQPLTRAETAKLLAAAKRQRDPLMLLGILLGVRAGLRAGEVLGLEWPDVNLSAGEATIRHARVWRRETTTKNHQLRTVHLTPSVIQAIKAVKRHPATPVILQRGGVPVSQEWLLKNFHKVLAAAHLPKQKFHNLRHTFISQLIAIGVDPKYIQDQAGHSTIAVTFDVYGHLFPGERYVDRLEPTAARPQRKRGRTA